MRAQADCRTIRRLGLLEAPLLLQEIAEIAPRRRGDAAAKLDRCAISVLRLFQTPEGGERIAARQRRDGRITRPCPPGWGFRRFGPAWLRVTRRRAERLYRVSQRHCFPPVLTGEESPFWINRLKGRLRPLRQIVAGSTSIVLCRA